MAQIATAQATSICDGLAFPRLTEIEIHEVGQYEKIVRFRDTVLSGKHPTIKLPPGLRALAESLSSQPKTASLIGGNSAVREGQRLSPDKAGQPREDKSLVVEASASAAPLASLASQPAQRPLSSARTEFNPILLEKSDELIRAEFQLQRQRLERALKDELDEHRIAKKEAPLILLDLSDLLSKALKLVEATATPLPADEDLTANHEAASDSFDDNTFYSSLHDSPKSNFTSHVRNPSEAVQVPGGASPTQQQWPGQVPGPTRSDLSSPVRESRNSVLPQSIVQPPHGFQTNTTDGRSGPIVIPGLNNPVPAPAGGPAAWQGPVGGGEASRTGGMKHQERGPQPLQPAVGSVADLRPPSPLVRSDAHLVHAAPLSSQVSTQVSPMELDSEPMPAPSGVGTASGTSVQINPLGGDITVITSDTSSQEERNGEKKHSRKKRRRLDQPAPETEGTTYIKLEPRSASPLTAPSYVRPNKRQRQSELEPAGPAGPADSDTTDPGYLRVPVEPPYDARQPHIYRQERMPIVYDEPTVYPRRIVNTAAVMREPRYGRGDADEYQVPDGAYIRRAPSPEGPPYPHSPREAHPSRAVTQVIVNDPYREPPHAYREFYDQPRMGGRPEGDPFLVPANPPPARIVVDAYGREYIEPPRPAPRHSVAPSSRPGEPEILYERVSSRAMSGHPGAGAYDEGGLVYTRQPSSYAVARRYLTQPEYIPHEYYETRHREYSTQPAGPSDYVRIMSPHDRRRMDERPQFSRAANVRPPDDVRYEAPHGYGRMHSVRPEAPAREHAGSGHPESRYVEGAPGYAGEHGSGSAQQQHQQQQGQQQQQQQQQPYLRREYSARPAEQYNEGPHGGGRRAEEIAFIEGPRRRTQEIVYVDDVRREVYRP